MNFFEKVGSYFKARFFGLSRKEAFMKTEADAAGHSYFMGGLMNGK